MRAPNFWFQPFSVLSFFLKPLSWIYELVHYLRWKFTSPKKASIPIICIGNPGVGGAGKTPTALEIGKILQSLHLNISYLTRGYGGKETGPLDVDSLKHTADQVGDEPLLLAKQAQTIMAKDRAQGLTLIHKKTDIIIMDDGYQNPGLKKDLNLLVIDGPRGFGNGFVFPAGPLREPLDMSLSRASLVVVLGKPTTSVEKTLGKMPSPIFYGQLKIQPPKALKNPLYAFAGIAFPEKFFDSLKGEKFILKKTKGFPDHYQYTKTDLTQIKKEAEKLGLDIVTTEKDYYRIPENQRSGIIPIPVQIEWDDEASLKTFLKKKLAL
jgi:tetraacyldisaccharide 4'-kinase